MNEYKKIEVLIPVPSQGLSPKDVVKMQGMIHAALVALADTIEAATDWDCDPAVQHAIAAGFRGDQELPRDA
jgi:hypothetical protein